MEISHFLLESRGLFVLLLFFLELRHFERLASLSISCIKAVEIPPKVK